ncbi:uncharacterized protein LOC111805882 isoform X2 [Cucurbita pepo subsp. pepo]|nr:uncharacterized protein LOC111805882 isoform X2 [Cucurbita pepo subsp. pepo]
MCIQKDSCRGIKPSFPLASWTLNKLDFVMAENVCIEVKYTMEEEPVKLLGMRLSRLDVIMIPQSDDGWPLQVSPLHYTQRFLRNYRRGVCLFRRFDSIGHLFSPLLLGIQTHSFSSSKYNVSDFEAG